jgi:hypothetical protein
VTYFLVADQARLVVPDRVNTEFAATGRRWSDSARQKAAVCDRQGQGILSVSKPPFRLRWLPTLANVPNFVVPVEVTGPIDFTLFAVWSKTSQRYRYVQAVVRAVETYRKTFAVSACVLLGDFNSSAKWDNQHPSASNHSALITLLAEHGLASGYHCFISEAQGIESRPTYYHRWNEHSPFHIDCCFLPGSWAEQITHVEVGGFDDWKGLSDHRPVVVDIDLISEEAADTEAGGVGILT